MNTHAATTLQILFSYKTRIAEPLRGINAQYTVRYNKIAYGLARSYQFDVFITGTKPKATEPNKA